MQIGRSMREAKRSRMFRLSCLRSWSWFVHAGTRFAFPSGNEVFSVLRTFIKERNVVATNNQAITTLNRLIETCKDGQKGYQTAAKSVSNVDLKALFASYAEQRAGYAAELQSDVMRLGGQPPEHGTLTGPVRRAWTNIKNIVSRGSEHAVIAECERSEDEAMERYLAAVKANLPPHVHALIERQLAGIREAHERVRALELATTHS
jgi:uncharacterized protein (TIGR02284 family)